jgi:hypothetical protein
MRPSTLSIDLYAMRARTAIKRTELSKPVTQALQDGVITPARSVLDYGCGRGGDVAKLRELGYIATGWDPIFAADEPLVAADIVNLGYVVNVIESPEERAETLRNAWNLTSSVLLVAARLDWEARGVGSQPIADGVVTTRGTFQVLQPVRAEVLDRISPRMRRTCGGTRCILHLPQPSERRISTRPPGTPTLHGSAAVNVAAAVRATQ